MTQSNVKTPKGRVVHRATAVWGRPEYERKSPYYQEFGLRAAVVCNKVPAWHAFQVCNSLPVNCQKCLVWIRRNGNSGGLPYVETRVFPARPMPPMPT